MSFDGQGEAASIFTRLLALAGGRGYEGMPDDTAIETFPDTSVKPFWVIEFGSSIPSGRGRGLAVTEAGQPHVFPFKLIGVANSGDSARNLVAGADNLLIGWVPNPPNSGEIAGVAGTSYTSLNSQAKPSRFYRARFYACPVNLSVG